MEAVDVFELATRGSGEMKEADATHRSPAELPRTKTLQEIEAPIQDSITSMEKAAAKATAENTTTSTVEKKEGNGAVKEAVRVFELVEKNSGEARVAVAASERSKAPGEDKTYVYALLSLIRKLRQHTASYIAFPSPLSTYSQPQILYNVLIKYKLSCFTHPLSCASTLAHHHFSNSLCNYFHAEYQASSYLTRSLKLSLPARINTLKIAFSISLLSLPTAPQHLAQPLLFAFLLPRYGHRLVHKHSLHRFPSSSHAT